MSAKNAGPASLALLPAETHNGWPGLRDLAFRLGVEAAGLASAPVPQVAAAIGDLVRGMNCYYSNLIEGHDTRPIDIERALHDDLAAEPKQRDLQLEAVAHITVQAAIDVGQLDGIVAPSALALDLHRRFYALLPDSLRWVENAATGQRVEVLPGELRSDPVAVGRHVPPLTAELPEWMARLDQAAPERYGRAERLVAIAALHHRLLWVHPFADGNGRVARLMSHALLRRVGVGSALWSISRGLARNVDAYRAHLARADAPPQSMTDGRGLLSDGQLAGFCRFFLAACIDQVRFMRMLLAPEALVSRVRQFVAAEAAAGTLDGRLGLLLERAALLGEVSRFELGALIGTGDRQARRLIQPLVDRGLLAVKGRDGLLRIAFPLAQTERLFPNLWAPSSVATALDADSEIYAALLSPVS